MNIKHPFVKPEIECTLAAGCAVTGEPFAIELAHVKGRLTMVSAKPIKAGAGGGSGGLKAKGVSVLAYYSDGTKMPYDIAD